MTEPKHWDGARVRLWLHHRIEAARVEQARADQRGYAAQDEYDVAAAEEWACRALVGHGAATARIDDQATFAAHIKVLLANDDYPVTGIHDDRRFERAVRATLRKVARMTKANEGFENVRRFQG